MARAHSAPVGAATHRRPQSGCSKRPVVRRRRALKSRQRRWRIELREPQRQPRAEGEEYIYLRPHGAGVCRIVAARRVEPLRGAHRGARASGTHVTSRRAPLPHGIVAARISTRPACRTRSHTVGRARSPRLHHLCARRRARPGCAHAARGRSERQVRRVRAVARHHIISHRAMSAAHQQTSFDEYNVSRAFQRSVGVTSSVCHACSVCAEAARRARCR
jgi:hypothetical protein